MHGKKQQKVRIDRLVADRGLVQSREKAQALIMAGKVLVNGEVAAKAGSAVPVDSVVEIKEGLPYVGRGGLKLEGALDAFSLDVTGKAVIDVGSSTGGFTDCLLQRHAASVVCIDVGKGLLDWKLRQDPRVKLLEGRNVRYLESAEVGVEADMAVVDVSFISLEKVLPKVAEFIKDNAVVLALVKPQFELGRGEVGKGGIVRDPDKHRLAVEKVEGFAGALGFEVEAKCESPIKGAKGNREFWLRLRLRPGR